MQCQSCGFNNEKDNKFCISCGSELIKNNRKKQKAEDILFVPQKKDSYTLRNIILTVVVIIVIILLIFSFAASDESTSTTTTRSNSTQNTTNNSVNGWQVFNSIEHGFKVSFPVYPNTDRIEPGTSYGVTYSGTQYSSEDSNKTAYLAQAADYNVAPSDYDSKTGLEGIVNSMFEGNEMILEISYFTTFRGFDAIEFTGKDSTNSYLFKGISFIRNDLSNIKAFILMVGSENDFSQNYIDFLDSFTFTD